MSKQDQGNQRQQHQGKPLITSGEETSNQEKSFPCVALVLGAIWFGGALCDRLWLALDHSIPAWDPTNHLTGSLNYLHALQHAEWFSGEWWTSLWMLSSKYPPLTYIATAPFQQLFGTGPDQALLVNLLFSGILLVSIYGIGKHLFNTEVGLWAAGLCLLFPRLYIIRLNYLIDYPLVALVAVNFWCLTVWRDTKAPHRAWFWTLAFGVCFGLAMLVKQTILFFLLVPLLWLVGIWLRQRDWGQILRLVCAFLVSAAIFGPWYRTNWLFIFSAQQNGIVIPALKEGDPALNTFAAWTYYWNDLPRAVTLPLLIVPLVGGLLYWSRFSRRDRIHYSHNPAAALRWLAVFLVGSYFICSANVNKDLRYIAPMLPILAVVLAFGLTLWSKQLRGVRWGTVGLAFLLLCFNLFRIGGLPGDYLVNALSPKSHNYPEREQAWPHVQVIEEIIRTQPQLQATLGVLPKTSEINHNTLNYYGALRNFQVYGREVGVRKRYQAKDVRSLSWFLTKTGDEATRTEAQALSVQTIEQSPEFQLQKNWTLPDRTLLKLYHRTPAPIQVKPAPQQIEKVKLERVTVPPQAPPGAPVPVTYEWTGSGEQLRSGIVLLTWKSTNSPSNSQPARWLHDHGIALGELRAAPARSFNVTEQLAMLPPADVAPGAYTLEATYSNRETGENYPIAVPSVTLNIVPNAPPLAAPELDLVTQLRTLATSLPKGREAIDPIFDEIGRINQYDPVQDYTAQAELALNYRLQQEPQNLDFAYALAFSRVLQEDTEGAIAALKQVVQLDAQNPFAHAYLAFVYLYEWRGKAAQQALQPALALNPNLPEIQALSGAAALLQGNVFKAWNTLRQLKL